MKMPLFQNCFKPHNSNIIKIVSYGGGTKTLTGKHIAGEIMFEFPDHMICRADSFYLGHPIPSLSIDDKLVKGQTYFLLPLDCFSNSNNVLSASSLAVLGLSSHGDRTRRNSKHVRCSSNKDLPFEYLKGSDGRVLIRVLPEFIERLITRDDDDGIVGREVEEDDGDHDGGDRGGSLLCSTPELKKHYNQLVGCNKDQVWSPKLETISEYKIRFSPYCRFIGLEWKQKEVDV